jgi:tetratricopeptide (TPR) repeat protein
VAARGPLAQKPADPRETRLAAVPRERLIGAGLIALTAVLCAWTAWQPARSDAASNQALELLAAGDLAEAAREADNAYDINPLSPKPLFVLAQVQDRAGNLPAAESTLEQAVVEHPEQPDVWLRLAELQLFRLDRPQSALDTLRGALYLDPRSRQVQTTFFDARARLREQEAARAADR